MILYNHYTGPDIMPPDINCCIYFMNVLCDFMDLIYIYILV